MIPAIMVQIETNGVPGRSLEEVQISALDKIERLFGSVVREVAGEQAEIPQGERYHADQIDETFTWQGPDSLQRNVQVWVRGDDLSRLNVSLLVHAWKDDMRLDRSGTRSYNTEDIGFLPIPFGKIKNAQLKKLLARAYRTVTSWNETNLTQKSPMPPLPRG